MVAMKTIDELVEEIMQGLSLGDNLYGEVMPIVKGKLLDRYDKLVGKKTRKDGIITQDRICNTVSHAVSGIMEGSFDNMTETSVYYKLKYDMDV